MTEVDPSLVQLVLDVPQRQRIPKVHKHDQPDHFGRRVKIQKRFGWLAGLDIPRPNPAITLSASQFNPFGSAVVTGT